LQAVQHGAPREFTAAEKAKLDSLTPFKEDLVEYVGQGKWVYEMAAKMKELGMADIVKNGLNYPKALLLPSFDISDRGKVTRGERRSLEGSEAPTQD
jgi:hypothetical protein